MCDLYNCIRPSLRPQIPSNYPIFIIYHYKIAASKSVSINSSDPSNNQRYNQRVQSQSWHSLDPTVPITQPIPLSPFIPHSQLMRTNPPSCLASLTENLVRTLQPPAELPGALTGRITVTPGPRSRQRQSTTSVADHH